MPEMKGRSPELFAGEGARLLLTAAIEEEVTEFLQRRPYERNSNSRGYRNGHRERQVSCGAGEIGLAVPRLSLQRRTFSFSVAWCLAASQ